MKKCNTELMKILKKLQQDKNIILRKERTNCVVKYSDTEEPIENDYNYFEVREAVSKIEEEERRIRALLGYSNATTMVIGYDFTISEALVYLTQLSNRKAHLESMVLINPLERSIVYNKVEYKKALFDPKAVAKEVEKLTEEISLLQMAIDRTNLTNLIDY